jgi:hypothetical protein
MHKSEDGPAAGEHGRSEHRSQPERLSLCVHVLVVRLSAERAGEGAHNLG